MIQGSGLAEAIGDVTERLCQVEFGVSRLGTLAREGYLKRLANRKNARFSEVILTEKGRNLYHSMFARFCQVNNQLLRDLSADQVQHLCTAISILRNTATQLNASSSVSTPINSK
jgi:hypothetical protein